MKYIIRGGRRNGEQIEADWKEINKLFRTGFTTKHDVASDGSVMISKVPKPELIFVAERGEEIEELK